MNEPKSSTNEKPLFLLIARSALLNIGWNLSNPPVVLTYMAVAHDVPVFVAGLLINVRRAAYMVIDLTGGVLLGNRRNPVVDLAISDVAIAASLLAVILSILFGSPLVIGITLVIAIFGLGVASELKSMLFADVTATIMRSGDRTRMRYWGMGLGGLGTILLAWPIHWLLLERQPELRHSAVVLAATMCFFVAALMVFTLRRSWMQRADSRPVGWKRWGTEFRDQWSHFTRLADAPWFRNLMIIRFSLQTVQIAVPFLAITAAITNAHSVHGITILIISAALALVVAAPLWRWLSLGSHRSVMVAASLLAAVSGVLLVGNHFLTLVSPTALHAVSLFGLTVAGKGVSSARSLYYLDIAPEADRIAGLSVSKSLGRVSAIALSTTLAAVAHLSHAIWAVAAIVVLNVLAAAICLALADAKRVEAQAA